MNDEKRLGALAETMAVWINALIKNDAEVVSKVLVDTTMSIPSIKRVLKLYLIEIFKKQVKEEMKC